ncbi:MAG: hypothetical protein ACK4N5_04920 [Myxococcales bacterium]
MPFRHITVLSAVLLVAACGTEPAAPIPPAAPRELTATRVGSGGPGYDVALAWSLDGAAATEQLIERKGSGEEFELVASVAGADRAWTDVKPPQGVVYSYRVRAKGPGGESPHSEEVEVAVPTAADLVARPPNATVRLSVAFDKSLNRPSGFGFHPTEGSLWIVNRGDDSTVIVDDFDRPGQRHVAFEDDSAHFMNNPTQLSFSNINTFGTCGETANDYNGQAQENYFMGPVVWTADRKDYEGGTMSHYDMLHETSYCMGITNKKEDEYWAFNGDKGSIDQNFFGEHHPLGADDHSDGRIYRYAVGEVKRVPNVPSHMVYNPDDDYVYIADTGNSRIARIRTNADLSKAKLIRGYLNETPLYAVDWTRTETVAKGPESGLVQPSGLLLYKGMLIVSDRATSRISVFNTRGERLGYADVSSQKDFLGGLAIRDDKLYVLDMKDNRVLRVDVTF